MFRCKVSSLADAIWPAIKSDIVPIIYGQPAIGKTYVIENDILPRMNRELGETIFHPWNMAGMDERDAYGVPMFNASEKETIWTRPALVPKEDGKFHLIFADDFGHASKPVQQVFYSVVHGKRVGGYHMPKNTRVVLATNRKEDKGGDNSILMPLADRCAHFLVEPDIKGVLNFGTEHDFDPIFLAFLTVRQELIYFKPGDEGPARPSPRKHEMANRILKAYPLDIAENQLIALCGEGFARECITFYKDCGAALPKLAEIKANPSTAKVPSETHHQYVVARAISEHIDESSAETWAKYLKRLTPDLASMAAMAAMTRNPCLKNNKILKNLRLG